MQDSLEEDRRIILKLWSETVLQYANFTIAFTVGLFVEINSYGLFGENQLWHALVWGALSATVASLLLSFEGYDYGVRVTRVIRETSPPRELAGTNTLDTLFKKYDQLTQEKLGRFKSLRMRRRENKGLVPMYQINIIVGLGGFFLALTVLTLLVVA